MLIRRLFSGLFLAFTIIYMSIVIYAPSVALAPVVGIHTYVLILVSCFTERTQEKLRYFRSLAYVQLCIPVSAG